MKIILVWLLGFLATALPGVAQDDIHFTLVPTAKDNPGSTTKCITQDKHGYLWIGTGTGLYKYDGHQYTSFHHEPLNPSSPASENTEWLITGRDGMIWLAPFCTGLDRLDPLTGKFTHFRHRANDPNSLQSDSVWVMLQDSKGILWIGTNSGLDQFDSKSNTFKHYTHQPNDSTSLTYSEVRAIYEDKQGTIWVGTGSAFTPDKASDGGLNKFNRETGTFTRYLHNDNDPQTLIDNRVRCIFEDSRGTFWIGTAGDGLHTMDRTTGQITRHRYNPLHPEELSRPAQKNNISYGVDHITFITEDLRGKIWIGSFENGINIYDPVTRKVSWYGAGKNSSGVLADEGVWTAYRTRDNIMLAGAWGNHLYKISPYDPILPHTRLGATVVSAVEDSAHTVWAATMHGLIHRYENGTQEQFFLSADTASPLNLMLTIQKDDKKFWISTYNGLYLFDPLTKKFTRYHHLPGIENSLVSDTLTMLKKNKDNTLWVCSVRGLDLMNTGTGTFRHFQHNSLRDSLDNAFVFVYTDKFNNTWTGALTGLYRLDKQTGAFKNYLDGFMVTGIMEDHAGTLWVATDAGLFRFNRQTESFLAFSDDAGILHKTSVFWITEDNNQNIWLTSTSKGLIRLNKDRTIATSYGKKTGAVNQVLTGFIFTRSNGELFLPDSSGYFSIQPQLLEQDAPVPTISINRFLLNNKEMLAFPAEAIHLTHDQHTFSFEFSNIDFTSDYEETRILYQLKNFENDWHKAGDERTAAYYNVSPGKYVFSVKVFNAFGNTAEKDIEVIISPPWWNTWWFYGLAVLLVVSLAYAIYRNRVTQLKNKQAAQMNIMVQAQEGERKRISRDLHDDVGTKLSALKLFLSSLNEKATISNNPEIQSLSNHSEQFITEIMQDLRQLLLNLSPAILEEFGYATAVETLINKINQTGKVHFDLLLFGMPNRLQKDYELALYRITQELINNVLKHAEAKKVQLQVGRRDEKIILMIEDDGKGFDTSTHKDGYGLNNLTARTKLMQGNIVIDSQPGRGTSILIEIPYNLD